MPFLRTLGAEPSYSTSPLLAIDGNAIGLQPEAPLTERALPELGELVPCWGVSPNDPDIVVFGFCTLRAFYCTYFPGFQWQQDLSGLCTEVADHIIQKKADNEMRMCCTCPALMKTLWVMWYAWTGAPQIFAGPQARAKRRSTDAIAAGLPCGPIGGYKTSPTLCYDNTTVLYCSNNALTTWDCSNEFCTIYDTGALSGAVAVCGYQI
jgi:hypothetical protein